MARGIGAEEFDLISLFFGFWLFIFSKSYRATWLEGFKQANLLFKVVRLFEALLSAFVGVVVPIGILTWLLGS